MPPRPKLLFCGVLVKAKKPSKSCAFYLLSVDRAGNVSSIIATIIPTLDTHSHAQATKLCGYVHTHRKCYTIAYRHTLQSHRSRGNVFMIRSKLHS